MRLIRKAGPCLNKYWPCKSSPLSYGVPLELPRPARNGFPVSCTGSKEKTCSSGASLQRPMRRPANSCSPSVKSTSAAQVGHTPQCRTIENVRPENRVAPSCMVRSWPCRVLSDMSASLATVTRRAGSRRMGRDSRHRKSEITVASPRLSRSLTVTGRAWLHDSTRTDHIRPINRMSTPTDPSRT